RGAWRSNRGRCARSRGPSCVPLLVVLLLGRVGLLGRRLARQLLDLGDLDARQLLAVAVALAVAPLGLELEDPQLLPAQVLDDLRVPLALARPVAAEAGFVGR